MLRRMIREFKGTFERGKAEIGLFVTLEQPFSEMKVEATTAGVSPYQHAQRIAEKRDAEQQELFG